MRKNKIIAKCGDAMAISFVMALSWLCCLPFSVSAENMEISPVDKAAGEAHRDSLTVSFVTCYPGPEIYELYGHEAIRIRGEGMDSVWNFGMFDFREPNFVYRFVKGETDYMVAGYPFMWFLPEYESRGSKVVEQDLNLTRTEARRFLALLQTASLPENRRYRYNYVKNNCATRIHELLDSVVESRVVYPDSVMYGTFREEMRAYNKNYPWYQFGIDIALGSGIDYPLRAREEMFVPVEMMRMVDGAMLRDGRKLVKESRVLVEGVPDATLPATPWYASPMSWSAVVALALLSVCIDCLRRTRIVRWVFFLWFLLLGIAGSLVAFLVFVSEHEATSPNTLLLWLNPLQLAMALSLCLRRLRPVALAMAYYNIVSMICMFIVWPLQHQSANMAFFPLMGANLLMALTYAIIAHKESYINNRHASSGRRRESRTISPGKKTAAKRNRKETSK